MKKHIYYPNLLTEKHKDHLQWYTTDSGYETLTYVNSLLKEHKDALEWYTTDSGHKILNHALRNNIIHILPKELTDKLVLIDNVFFDCPKLKESIVVYRGLDLDNYTDINFTTNSFISTSLDYETSLDFTGKTCCILKIHVPPGSKILPLKNIAKDVAHEQEILLDRYSKIFITNINDKKAITVIDCNYIPETSVCVESIKDIKEAKIVFSNDEIEYNLLNILHDEIEEGLFNTMEEFQEQLEILANKLGYELNKDILKSIKEKVFSKVLSK